LSPETSDTEKRAHVERLLEIATSQGNLWPNDVARLGRYDCLAGAGGSQNRELECLRRYSLLRS
jgi:hypothetical protein